MVYTSNSTDETRRFGAEAAARAAPGDIYGLVGGLGSGKTEFTRGFAGHFLPQGTVWSPSFALLNIYETQRFPIYHFDFYRLKDRRELIEIGFDDYAYGSGVCVIEWASLFMDELPADMTRIITFEDNGGTTRTIRMDDARAG